jgi:hypothetical protein
MASGACGGAAFAACCITARERTITEINGKNKITHRIFMQQSSTFALDGIIPYVIEGSHPRALSGSFSTLRW